MIGHKSQGATISTNVVVDIRNAFAPGLTYVMLSRVTNRANLKIKGRLLHRTSFHVRSQRPHLQIHFQVHSESNPIGFHCIDLNTSV